MDVMPHLYLFSGLGADQRAFERLDLSSFEVTHIHWVSPEPNETIAQYATRLRAQIIVPNPILIGLSFGGMVAIEVAKQIPTKYLILLASAKRRQEIPAYLRGLGTLRLHKLIPTRLLTWPNPLMYWLFGVTTKPDQALLRAILHDTDLTFLKWAIHAIATWQNDTLPANILHLHGTTDRILPIEYISNAVAVQGGGHLMTLEKADAISERIRHQLARFSE